MAKCKVCGDDLRGMTLSEETLAQDAHPDPNDTGFRLAHSNKDMKLRCLDIQREKLQRTLRVTGQTYYDPVKKQMMWIATNWMPYGA